MEFPEGFPEHFREVLEFRFSLNDETDRGCALMVAAFLDAKLEQILSARFVDDPKVSAEHLSQSGPLATFSSRIDAAYLLGIIGLNTRRDLHLIRKIRNEFGHTHKAIRFSNENIHNRCRELFHFKNLESTTDARKMFVKTTISILAMLNADLRGLTHLPAGTDLSVSVETQDKNRAQSDKLVESLRGVSEESTTAILAAFADLLQSKDSS